MITKNKPALIILLIFVAINVIFNFPLWRGIFSSSSDFPSVVSDNVITEFLTEESYINIKSFKNPFSTTRQIFFPFETNFTLNDPSTINAIFFLFLRPFFDAHRSTLFIVVINIFLANVLMYILLCRLGVSRYSCFIASLIFGFTPFISHRLLGQYTYTAIYLFPLQFLAIHLYVTSKALKSKAIVSLLYGAVLALTLFASFYYFIASIIFIALYVLAYFLFNRDKLFVFVKRNIRFIALSAVSFFVVLAPWLTQVRRLLYFDSLVEMEGYGGAQDLSADFLNFFTPNFYNPIYVYIVLRIQDTTAQFEKYANFFFNSWNRFVYPGIIILAVYLFILLFNKKLNTKLRKKIMPFFLVSLFFALLVMGPFFRVANRWAYPLEEGLHFILPLPFLIFHYIPGMSLLRAPMRFAPVFIFFASIVSAYVLDYWLLKLKKGKLLIYVFIFLIFFIDQLYVLPRTAFKPLPQKAYEIIKNDPQQSTVLEIPFTVRDGFSYMGFIHGVSPMRGMLEHKKPIIGGYLARVSAEVFDYYQQLPFIGYVTQIIDKGNYDPLREKPKDPRIIAFKAGEDAVQAEIEFLDIKYVVLKENEKYTQVLTSLLKNIGFTKKIEDAGYTLYERPFKGHEVESIDFGTGRDYLYTLSGFSFQEGDFRWAQGRVARVLFKTNNIQKKKLKMEMLSFYEPQKVEIYLNQRYVDIKKIDTKKQEVIVDVADMILPGINTITFKFEKSFTPSKLWSNDKDTRDLAVKFFTLKIE